MRIESVDTLRPIPPGHPAAPPGEPRGGVGALRRFFAKYGRMLWWLHSFYALGLGITVVLFAAKGFAHARWLTISLGTAWLVLILFFRLFGSGAQRAVVDGKAAKLRFFVMTYVLKNLYQGMLFFLLPFYWQSVTLGSQNQWFLVALVVCTFVSTLDVVFDHLLMRWKSAASTFYFFTLFACLNLVIPALLPNIASLASLIGAAAISAIAFWTMHMPVRLLAKPLFAGLCVGWVLLAVAGAYAARGAVPPAAMHVTSGAVGPELLADGRLRVEARSLHVSMIDRLYAVTYVNIPGGRGDNLVHEWWREGSLVQRVEQVTVHLVDPPGTVRVRSELAAVPTEKIGEWRVDVVTADGQLVGRVPFTVIQ
jgi:hypothetical protein